MDLTLTVIDAPDDVNMINHTKAFRAEGGTFGRSDNNTWVLPDNERVVSSTHAQISFRDGHYVLTDKSTNGTFHNDEKTAIGQNQERTLTSGDVIIAGNYQIKATIKSTEKALPKGLQSAGFLDSADKTTFTPAVKAEQENLSQARELDNWLEPASSTPPPAASASQWGTAGNTGAQNTPFVAPALGNPQPTHNSFDTISSGAPATSSSDPLVALGLNSELTSANPASANMVDPLAALDSAANVSPAAASAWDDDDDWWREGSDSDNAPAHSQSISLPLAEPVEEPASAPVQQPNIPASYSSSAAHQSSAPQPMAYTQHQRLDSPAPQVHSPQAQNPSHFSQTNNAALAADHNVHSSALSPEQPSNQAGQHQPTTPHQDPIQQQAPVHQTAHISPPPPAVSPREHQQAPAFTTAQPNQPAQSIPPTAAYDLAGELQLTQLPPAQLAALVPESAAIINETVNRLIDLLRARSSIKNELRVQRTMIQSVDNNPLKFSASSADALKAMFNGDNQAFMRPREAVQDSFDDLSDHQVAVLSGMRAAYDAILKHFNPANLEKRFNNQSSLLSNKKTKDWESFEEHYASLMRDSESTYDLLFGEQFASSYEKQLSELKTARSLTKNR